MSAVPLEVNIRSIGAKGDGIADVNGTQVFVPFSAPGDNLEISLDEKGSRGEIMRLISPGADRQSPPCNHFQACGGCAVQHLSSDAYLSWKRELVVTALRHRGLGDVDVRQIISVPRRSRRRAVFKWGPCADGAVGLGFQQRRTHSVIDVKECHVIDPSIEAALPKLRTVLAATACAACSCTVHLTKADNGLDIHVSSDRKPLQLNQTDRQLWIDALADNPVVRLTIDNEILLQKAPPTIGFDGIHVAIPPSAFLQATTASEAALIDYTKRALKGCRKLVDLYCGVGTLSLPLSRDSQITGFDSRADSIAALTAAAKATPGLKFRSAETRDLERRPLLAEELREFDGAIVDPPRAGAANQIREVVKSSINRVVMVSCNPNTFARDARTLIDAGFDMMDIQPIDQFLWSDHVEVCGTFVRKKGHVVR